MDKKLHITAVIYTDGSFKPVDTEKQIGYRGCGIHGYLYETGKKQSKPQTDLPNGIVTTETGYEDNKSTLKYVLPLEYLDIVLACANQGTSATAELEAGILAIKTIADKETYIVDKLVMWIDSQYLINLITAIQNGTIDTVAKANLDYVEELKKQMARIPVIEVKKSEAHTGEIGNETADKLANMGRNMAIHGKFNTFVKFTNKAYWRSTPKPHPMVNFRQLFFTSNFRAPGTEVLYHVMDYKKSSEPGKKTPEAAFGLVKLTEQDQTIADTISSFIQQCHSRKQYYAVNSLDLGVMYGRNTQTYFNLVNQYSYILRKDLRLVNAYNEIVAAPIVPTGLALQAMDQMQELYEVLKDVEQDNNVYNKIDITSYIYDPVKYKTLLTANDTAIKVETKIDGKPFKLEITLGVDTLPRMSFKNLEKQKPKVYLVYRYMEKDVFSYYTAVILEDKSIGVYCNFYTSKVYLAQK